MQIQIYGPFRSHAGPSEHCKEFVRALQRAGNEVSLRSHFYDNKDFAIEKDIFAMTELPEFETAPTIMIDPPYCYWQHMAERRHPLIGIMVMEGDTIPYDWAKAAAQPEMTQIWCPSTHSRDAVLNAYKVFSNLGNAEAIANKTHVVPHGVNIDVFKPMEEKLPIENPDYFTFLFVGGYSQGLADRKQLHIAYQAFLREFKPEEKVRFIMKITSVYNPPGYDPVQFLTQLQPNENPHLPLYSIQQDIGVKDGLAKLYNTADVFVLPSAAEGFGMTALEAMACEKPVITNDFGGQTDFVNNENGWINTEGIMDWSKDMNVIQYDFCKWKFPKIEAWQKLMRYVFEHQDEAKEKGKKARQMAEKFTWDNSARIALDLLSKEL